MKKVVLAIDSFKGCLSSIEADKTAEQGIKIVCSDIVKREVCVPLQPIFQEHL